VSLERTAARIHPSVFIAAGAVVLGDVTLGPRASVWFNTVVRGDSAPVVIGEDTNLQDNTVVHEDEGLPALVGARVTVGHRSIIHGCVIEDDCLIGMGSVILSGARIGRGSLIGAASLVREGQEIAPGSLVVGSPARVLGPVNDGHRASIRNGWSHYAELARFYMIGGEARAADPRGAVTRDRGPMSNREWTELIRILAEGPEWVARLASDLDPARGAFPARALAAADHERLPFLEALVRGEQPMVDEHPAGEPQSGDWAKAWRQVRMRLCLRLETLAPEDWIRLAAHPTRGALTLAEVVREWVERELDLRRKIARAVVAR
jgi:carbonic anhydrase/acetyltransferase-like protein (isoleucine patch superfamily)